MKKIFQVFSNVLLIALLLTASIVSAQAQTVTGTVTDENDGQPVPGVNVLVVGTSTGTTTDLNGNYTLNVTDGASLSFSFVGYLTQTIVVGNQSVINISFATDVETLAEVVVTGYGTQEKKEITSSVASVKAKDFNQGNITSPAQLLQGKVAGLSIVKAGGDPNGTSEIRLRGLSTFGANTSPLIVVDGVIGASLESVDPNNIASIDVLKDGSAAAIYGARGSSGVILITTKSGNSGRGNISVDYTGYVTIDQAKDEIPVLSTSDFVAQGGTDFGSDTNWFDELTRTAYSYTQSIAVSGGTNTTSYRAAVNWRDNQGVTEGVDFTNLNTSFSVSHKAVDGRLRLSLNTTVNNRDQTAINNEAFRYAVIYNPSAPIFDNVEDDIDGGFFQRPLFDFFNPVALAQQQQFVEERKRILTNYRIEFDIMDGLTIAGNYSENRESNLTGSYFSKFDPFQGAGGNGIARRTTSDNFTKIVNTTVNYNNQFGDLDLNFLVGFEDQRRSNEGFGAQTRNFLFDDLGFNNLGGAGILLGSNTDVFSFKSADELTSYFGRVNLNYNNTYFLSASIRREAFSGFGENERSGYFPAVSGGVQLSELFDMGPVNSFKFRASYGVTGNLPPSANLALPLFGNGSRVDLDGNPLTGGDVFVSPVQRNNPNPTLKWEKKTEFDVGIDFGLMDNKITGTLDYYSRDISDLLFNVGVPIGAPNPFLPGGVNTVGTTWANIGDLSAAGFEMAVSVNQIDFGMVKWTPSINFTIYDKTEIDKLTNGELGFTEIRLATPGSPGQNNNEIIRNKVGETLGNMYGPRFLGVNADGTINLSTQNPDEFEVVGNGLPDGEFGFANLIQIQNFDINLFFRGAWGHDLYNSYRGFYEARDASSNTWNSVNTELADPNITGAPTFSDLYVESATFLKLDNMQIGYTLPMNSNTFSKVRIYIAGQNLFTITDYTGIDPEVRYKDSEIGDSFNANLAPGLERRGTFYATRSYTFGVNLSIK